MSDFVILSVCLCVCVCVSVCFSYYLALKIHIKFASSHVHFQDIQVSEQSTAKLNWQAFPVLTTDLAALYKHIFRSVLIKL